MGALVDEKLKAIDPDYNNTWNLNADPDYADPNGNYALQLMRMGSALQNALQISGLPSDP